MLSSIWPIVLAPLAVPATNLLIHPRTGEPESPRSEGEDGMADDHGKDTRPPPSPHPSLPPTLPSSLPRPLPRPLPPSAPRSLAPSLAPPGLAGSRAVAPRPATPGEISYSRPATPSDPGRSARPGRLSNAVPYTYLTWIETNVFGKAVKEPNDPCDCEGSSPILWCE